MIYPLQILSHILPFPFTFHHFFLTPKVLLAVLQLVMQFHIFYFRFLNCSSPIFHMANSKSRTQPNTTSSGKSPRSFSVGWVLLRTAKVHCACSTESLSHYSNCSPMCLFPPLDYELFNNKDYIIFIIVFPA